MSATARGDFFRALLVLKDAVQRLEKDPQASRELARAHAYLAWAYDGLNRPEDAKAAVERALKADPRIIVSPDVFPARIVSLFKRNR